MCYCSLCSYSWFSSPKYRSVQNNLSGFDDGNCNVYGLFRTQAWRHADSDSGTGVSETRTTVVSFVCSLICLFCPYSVNTFFFLSLSFYFVFLCLSASICFIRFCLFKDGPDSVVGGPVIEYQLGRDYPHPSRLGLLYNGYLVSWPGLKRQGRGVNHPTPSSTDVKDKVELYVCSPRQSSWAVLGRTLPWPSVLSDFAFLRSAYRNPSVCHAYRDLGSAERILMKKMLFLSSNEFVNTFWVWWNSNGSGRCHARTCRTQRTEIVSSKSCREVWRMCCI